MRRIVVTGLIVFSALTLSMVGGAADQRTRGVGAALTRTPTQVEVTNFPVVQGVSGTVNVGNLQAVQTIAGSVTVSNLPLDSDGRLLVAGLVTAPNREVHFLGYAQARFSNLTSITLLNDACASEIAGSRMCTMDEFNFALPTGRVEPADPCALFGGFRNNGDVLRVLGPDANVGLEVDLMKGTANQCYTPDNPIAPTYRAACCGF